MAYLLPNLSNAVNTHILTPVPCIQHISKRDHSHVRRVIFIISVFTLIRIILIQVHLRVFFLCPRLARLDVVGCRQRLNSEASRKDAASHDVIDLQRIRTFLAEQVRSALR